MFVANPIDPSFPTIRYLNTLGPASAYPRQSGRAAGAVRRGQRGQLSAIAGVVLAVAAFGAGFLGGWSAAGPAVSSHTAYGPMPGEFRLGPGNLTPPGIVVPLH
jgi:hypothetical protein